MDRTTINKVWVIKGDITEIEVDAIVNSAHQSYLSGSGVSGAIHKAAGKELEVECRRIEVKDLPHGQVPLTEGFNLPAKHIIHVVVPIAKEKGEMSPSEKSGLIKCYKEAIYTANQCGIKTLAFPSLGTGIRAYPLKKVAELAIKTIFEYLDEYVPEAFEMVYIVTYSDSDFQVYKHAYDQYLIHYGEKMEKRKHKHNENK